MIANLNIGVRANKICLASLALRDATKRDSSGRSHKDGNGDASVHGGGHSGHRRQTVRANEILG
jgi:hypothetical protein